MEHFFYAAGLVIFSTLTVINSASAAEQKSSMATDAADGKKQDTRPLSAFFGLDNGLPFVANALCLGASGMDGMPVVLSHTVDPYALEPEQFRIITRSQDMRTPKCVTLRPAYDSGERRTVLLIGEFGDALDDPPMLVQIVGDLFSDGIPPINFKGTETQVTPLDAGPSLVLAEIVPESEWEQRRSGTACPEGIQQIVRVTWDGGIKLPNGDEPGDAERGLYRVQVQRADGSVDKIYPVALAELGDGDNNHFLCLKTADPVIAVSFPAGHLVDPNSDLNPATHIMVRRSKSGK